MSVVLAQTRRMTGPSSSTARPAPRDGDVVVEYAPRVAAAYTLYQVPAPAQIATAVKSEAMRIAREFAEEISVNLWYRDAGGYTLVASYRPSDKS